MVREEKRVIKQCFFLFSCSISLIAVCVCVPLVDVQHVHAKCVLLPSNSTFSAFSIWKMIVPYLAWLQQSNKKYEKKIEKTRHEMSLRHALKLWFHNLLYSLLSFCLCLQINQYSKKKRNHFFDCSKEDTPNFKWVMKFNIRSMEQFSMKWSLEQKKNLVSKYQFVASICESFFSSWIRSVEADIFFSLLLFSWIFLASEKSRSIKLKRTINEKSGEALLRQYCTVFLVTTTETSWAKSYAT